MTNNELLMSPLLPLTPIIDLFGYIYCCINNYNYNSKLL